MLLEGARLEAPTAPLDDLLAVRPRGRPGRGRRSFRPTARSAGASSSEASAALAGGYRGLGLEPGDRVASLMPNRIDLVVHYLACFRAGLIATPLNYRYTPARSTTRSR